MTKRKRTQDPLDRVSGPGRFLNASVLMRVVEHYHKTFCEREDAQAYLKQRGLMDRDLLRALKVGYADGSLLKVLPKEGELRDQVAALGVVTSEGMKPRAQLAKEMRQFLRAVALPDVK